MALPNNIEPLIWESYFYSIHSNTGDLTYAQAANYFKLFIFGYNEIADGRVDLLLQHNNNLNVHVYDTYDNAPDPDRDAEKAVGTPKGPTARRRNSLFWEANDIVNIRDAQYNPLWWLHTTTGAIYYQPSDLEVYFNLKRDGVRNFQKNRLVGLLPGVYNGRWQDNFHMRFRGQTGADQASQEYPVLGGVTWWIDQLDYLAWMNINALHPYEGRTTSRLWNCINLQQGGAEELERTIWAFKSGTIDLDMIEFFGPRFDGTLPSGDGQWYRNLIKSEYGQAHGVHMQHVAQLDSPTAYANPGALTTPGTATYILGFSLASHLLTVGSANLSTLRLGADAHYGKAYIFPAVEQMEQLGAPLGRYTVSGNVYTRVFSNGTVTVNPVANTWSVTITNSNYLATATNIPPVVTQAIDRTYFVGDSIDFYIYASHRQNKPMTFTATGLPDGVRINRKTGRVKGKGLSTNRPIGGRYTVTATVSDGTDSVSTTFVLELLAGNRIAAITPKTTSAAVPDNAGDAWDYVSDSTIGAALVTSGTGGSSTQGTQPTVPVGIPDRYVNNFQPPSRQADLLRYFRNHGTSFSYLIHLLSGVTITAGKTYEIFVGGNSTNDTVNQRTQRIRANGFTLQDNINWFTEAGGVANTAILKAYQYTPAINELTILTEKGAAGGSNPRLFGAVEVYEVATVTNTAPTIATIADRTISQGATQQFTVSASDPDGTPLEFSLGAGAPEWVTLVDNFDNTCTVTLAPPNGSSAGSPYNVTVQVTDGIATTSDTFAVTVSSGNTAPVLAAIANVTVAENATATRNISATDADGNAITFSLSNHPSFVSLKDNGNGTGVITIAPGFEDSGTYNGITVTASDGLATDTETFSVTVTNTNRAPSVLAISDVTIAENAAPEVVYISAVDSDGQTLTLSISNNPSFVTFQDFGDNTGAITIAPGFNDAGAYSGITITASDGVLTDTETFDLTVTNTNRAPVLSAISNVTIAEGATPVVVGVSATDPDGQPLTLSIANQPSFVSFEDNGDGTGEITIAPGYEDVGVYSGIAVTATDGSLTDTETFTITVTNTNRAPVLSSIGAKIVTAGSVLTPSVNASDPDAGATLTLSLQGTVPTWVSLTSNTGSSATLLIAPAANVTPGDYTVTVRVSDGTLFDEEVVTITVNAPAVSGVGRKRMPPRRSRRRR
jgi:hypothetical protein